MFTAVCPHCSLSYQLDESLIGKRATCKGCRKVFLLQNAGDEVDRTIVQSPEHLHPSDSELDFQLSAHQESPTVGTSVQDFVLAKPGDVKTAESFSADSGLWNVGDLILGVYEVRELAAGISHAEGGVGVVNRVYHREWDMDLAVKSPKPQFFQSEHGKRSYEQEAQTWIELGLHPNIVTCYLVRRIGGIPRLFAEFVSDGSLRDWIVDGRLYYGGKGASLLRILNIAIQFAWGLTHAHRQSLLHLDVKPANVMMSKETAKVSDFGLSQISLNTDVSNAHKSDQYLTVGMTPGYCSPEQYLSVSLVKKRQFDQMPKLTVQTDIWSWAVSVLGMFVGVPPCNRQGGQNARTVCQEFLQKATPEKCPEIPDAVSELLMQCFEYEPAKRPESMEQIADTLTKIYKTVIGSDFPRPKPINTTCTPDSINNRAVSLLDLNKPDESAKLFNQAIAMQPWHPTVTYNRTVLSWRRAQLTDLEVVEQLETLIKMRPQSLSAVYSLGLAQRERGNLESALESFTVFLEQEDRDDVRRAIAATKQQLADNARCIEHYALSDPPECKVYAENKGELMLFYSEPQVLHCHSTLTGQLFQSFKIATDQAKTGERFALSKDLLWELYTESTGFSMRRVGSSPASHTFQPINWVRLFRSSQVDEPADNTASHRVVLPDKAMFGEVVQNRVDIYNTTTNRKIGSLQGHEDAITAFAFNLTGRFALTAGQDRTLRLWELPLCRCLRTFPLPKQTVDSLYFDPSGIFALSVTPTGTLRLWSVSVLCRARPFRAPLQLSHVTSAEEAGRQQSELEKMCDEIRQSVKKRDYAAALDWIDKAKQHSGWEAAHYLLELEGVGDKIRRRTIRKSFASALCSHRLSGHQDAISCIAISLDANLIASAGQDGEIRVWNIAEQKCVADIAAHHDEVRGVELTLDAKFLVSGSRDGSVQVWNISTGKSVRKYSERLMTLTKIALNPQAKTVAMADGAGTIILWNVLTNLVIDRVNCQNGGVTAIRFSRDGHHIAAGGNDGSVTIWQIDDKTRTTSDRLKTAEHSRMPVNVFKEHQSPVTATALSVDMTRCFSADKKGYISVRNLQSAKTEHFFQGHTSEITGLGLLADSRFLFSASKDGNIKVWNLTESIRPETITGAVIEGHPSAITSICLEISGRRLVTGCADGVVRAWEVLWNHMPAESGSPPAQHLAKAKSAMHALLSLHSEDGAVKPNIDETISARILLEMDYSGFGTIPQNMLKKMLDDMLAVWNG